MRVNIALAGEIIEATQALSASYAEERLAERRAATWPYSHPAVRPLPRGDGRPFDR